jgi:predicted transposase
MMAQATIRLKVPYSKAIIITMLEFSKASQFAYNHALKHKIYSWKTLHQRTYEDIRKQFKLPSQLSCKAIKLRKQANALRNVWGLSVNQPIVAEYVQSSSDKPTTSVVGS